MLISLPYQHNRQAKNNNKFYSEKKKSFSAMPYSVLMKIFTEKNIKHIERIKMIY